MIPQVTHRLPQVLLRAGAEDLGARPFRFGPLGAEQDPPAPEAVFGAAQGESDVYGLSVKANRRQVVDDRIGWRSSYISGRLCRHADPGLVLKNIINDLELRNTSRAACGVRPDQPNDAYDARLG